MCYVSRVSVHSWIRNKICKWKLNVIFLKAVVRLCHCTMLPSCGHQALMQFFQKWPFLCTMKFILTLQPQIKCVHHNQQEDKQQWYEHIRHFQSNVKKKKKSKKHESNFHPPDLTWKYYDISFTVSDWYCKTRKTISVEQLFNSHFQEDKRTGRDGEK